MVIFVRLKEREAVAQIGSVYCFLKLKMKKCGLATVQYLCSNSVLLVHGTDGFVQRSICQILSLP